MFAVLEDENSIELINESLQDIEFVNRSKVNCIKIEVKVEIIVLYETKEYDFILKPNQSIHDLKMCI